MASEQRASMVGLIAKKATRTSMVASKVLQITLAIWGREKEGDQRMTNQS